MTETSHSDSKLSIKIVSNNQILAKTLNDLRSD